MRKLKRIILQIVQFALVISVYTHAVRAAGEVDPTYNSGVVQQPNRNVFALKRQADGKILVGGDFEAANGALRYGIARINPDGTPDATFYPPATLQGAIRAIAIQSDGKILIGGNLLIPLLTNWTYVARLNADGSFDNTFTNITTTQEFPANTNSVNDIAIAPDGKVFIAGTFIYTPPQGATKSKFARLNANGTLDAAFSPAGQFTDISDIEIQTDGKIVGVTTDGGGGSRFVKRFTTDGSEDSTFNALVTGSVNALKILADGKLLIGGDFNFVNNVARVDAARLNTDGTLDTTFNVTTNGVVNDIDVDAGGGVLLGGTFTTFNGAARRYIARTDASGNTDNTFVNPLPQFQFVYVILPTPDGKVISSVASVELANSGRTVIRQNSDGTIDNSFAVKIGVRGLVTKIAVQPDGKILVIGDFGALNSFSRRQFGRFNADGTPDTTFIPDPDTNAYVLNAVAVQPDGKILLGGTDPYSIPLKRLNADGSYDTGFAAFTGLFRFVNDIAVQPDGKILIIGGDDNFKFVRRFNANGTPDNTFTTTTTGIGSRIILQPNGKILIAGNFTAVNGTPRGRVARLNADGTTDSTFNPLGGANNMVNDIALQADGKIVIGGSFLSYNGSARNYIARLNADGNLDGSFTTSADAPVRAVKIESNGKIIIGGDFITVNGAARNRITRLNTDGSLDSSFNVGAGINGLTYSLALQSDGKIIVGGNFTKYNNVPKISIVRLLNSTAVRTPFDFDGDGKADLSVFRPSNGAWYVQQSNNGFAGQLFGQTGDRIVPADYDGDGKTDLAVYRGGNWYIQRSSLGFTAVLFGDGADIPAPADYDGDGKADICVYRPSTGVWYQIKSSINQASFVAFGIAEDLPTAGDYDGDGKADISVFRPSAGTWYRINSSTGLWSGFAFGAAGDKTVQADYDGDGKTDFAVYRGGTWYLQRSQLGFTGVAFGDGNDKPTPADYDGDGRTDVAVFRPSNGVWYLLRSTQGFTGAAFGAAEDNPIPNAFVR